MLAGRLARAKATHSGRAVKASPKLWIVSARSATDPEKATTTTWSSAVAIRTPSDIFSARMPSSLEARASSTESAES